MRASLRHWSLWSSGAAQVPGEAQGMRLSYAVCNFRSLVFGDAALWTEARLCDLREYVLAGVTREKP